MNQLLFFYLEYQKYFSIEITIFTGYLFLMQKTVSPLFLFLAFSLSAFSQQHNQSSSDILLKMQKLNTLGSVLYIAAHPDDENTRLLSYYANEKQFRTAYLSLTRGDGGQNLVGTEQGDLLGVIRTQELLAARQIDGAEQFFSRAIDFGYSKTPEETFSIWNKDSILSDVVWTIRKFQPDIIILRFPVTGEGGHGHHTASAILGLEAFEAAADKTKFPEQLKFVKPWQATRIFWNMFRVKEEDVKGKADIIPVDIGTYNEILGKSFGEMASESRSMHKSQGFGAAKNRGVQNDYIKILKGLDLIGDEFSGINTSWERLKGSKDISESITSLIDNFNVQSPEESIEKLLIIRSLILSTVKNEYWRTQKAKEVEELILSCAGIFAEALADTYSATPGESVSMNASVIHRTNEKVSLLKVSIPGYTADTSLSSSMPYNVLLNIPRSLKIPENVNYTNPYWLEKRNSIGRFASTDPLSIGIPEAPSAIQIEFQLKINEDTFKIRRPLQYKWVDPVRGELYRAFEILPAVSIHPVDPINIFTKPVAQDINLSLRANKSQCEGELQLYAPKGWLISPEKFNFEIAEKNQEQKFTFKISPPKEYTESTLSFSVLTDGKKLSKTVHRVEHDHIPVQTLVRDAEAELIHLDLNTLALNVGYIEGAGDNIPAALKQIGYDVKFLDDDMLSRGDLSHFDVIITGIRLYNTNERMNVYQPRLMEYVKAGGTLLVQYNTSNFLSSLKADIGPYPFQITRDRVTDETAEVRFLKKDHKLLTQPNLITASDFKGWIQERGLYFAGDYDSKYETLFSMNDPDSKELEGSLIYAEYGSGKFIYTGLSFFRELPAGVPGAYRLFVNLMSAGYPQHD